MASSILKPFTGGQSDDHSALRGKGCEDSSSRLSIRPNIIKLVDPTKVACDSPIPDLASAWSFSESVAARLVCNTSPQDSFSSCSSRLCRMCTSLSRVQAYRHTKMYMYARSLHKLSLADCAYLRNLEQARSALARRKRCSMLHHRRYQKQTCASGRTLWGTRAAKGCPASTTGGCAS